MPIYEYECQACGEHCEILQKMKDPATTVCPHCQAQELTRLVSATRFQLKGTGWYVTDFRNKDKPQQKEPTAPKEKKADNKANNKETKDKK